MGGMEQSEKEAERRKIVKEGTASALITKIDTVIGNARKGSYIVDNKLSVADIHVYAMFSHMFCGFFDGLSVDMLSAWPNIQAVRKTVACLPAVVKFYDEGSGKVLNESHRAAFTSARD